jgi:hypothetical protein
MQVSRDRRSETHRRTSDDNAYHNANDNDGRYRNIENNDSEYRYWTRQNRIAHIRSLRRKPEQLSDFQDTVEIHSSPLLEQGSRDTALVIRGRLHDLWPYTNISIRLSVMNAKFEGPPTDVITFSTDESGNIENSYLTAADCKTVA